MFRKFLLAGALAGFLVLSTSAVAAPPMPPPLVEDVPAAPGAGYAWVPGQWEWHPVANQYTWTSGYWIASAPVVVVAAPVVVRRPVVVRPRPVVVIRHRHGRR